MVIVEGSAAQTYRVFLGLLAVACSNTATGAALRARIENAYQRIASWKTGHAEKLRRVVDVPASTISAVIAGLPADDADLHSFTFDHAALLRLQPALLSASMEQ
jgi:hypothetical protein